MFTSSFKIITVIFNSERIIIAAFDSAIAIGVTFNSGKVEEDLIRKLLDFDFPK